MATEVNKELSSIVECCICTEIFTDPRMLPCIHTFCVKCLTETGLRAKKGPGDKMPCPLCRVEFVIPPSGFMGLQKNFFMDKIVNVVQLSSKHHVCESNKGDCSSAKWYCNECKQKLCSDCSMINTKLHSVEHHTLVPFENQNIDKTITEICTSTFCDEHEREELKIFCNDCHVVLCALCFLEGHQSHKWSQVKEVANKFKTQIQSNMAILSSCEPEARSKLDQLEKDNIKFLETMSKVESEINKKKLEVKALLNEIVEENANSLLLELTSLKRTASKDKGIEKEEIDRHLATLESHITWCNDIATKGSDVDICRSASELDNRAKELKELHGVAMKQKSATSRISFEESNPEEFLKTFGNLLGKIQDDHPDMAYSQLQQQNPQVIMSGMPAYMPYMVRQGATTKALPQLTTQQIADIQKSSRFPRTMVTSQKQPQEQQQQQQQQQKQQQTGYVQQEQPHYSKLPLDFNYHLTAAGMHPAYPQATQVPVPQRSDGSMVSLRFQQQPMPLQRMMPPSMPQPGMPQEMPPEVVARPPMHVAEPAQRPQFMPRPQRSDIVYYDTSKGGTDADDKASQATKPKTKCALTIIDPSTGQNVLQTLEMSSRQTSDEALKIQSEFAHKVTQRISLGDKAPNVSIEKMPTQPLHGARPKNLVAAAPTTILYEDQPLEIRPEEATTISDVLLMKSFMPNSGFPVTPVPVTTDWTTVSRKGSRTRYEVPRSRTFDVPRSIQQ